MKIDSVSSLPRQRSIQTTSEQNRDVIQSTDDRTMGAIRVKEVGKKELRSDVGQEDPRHFSQQDLLDNLERLNRTICTFNKRFEFKVHDETNRIMVAVIDKETDEVVREIPPEEILDMVAKIEEAVGLLVDQLM